MSEDLFLILRSSRELAMKVCSIQTTYMGLCTQNSYCPHKVPVFPTLFHIYQFYTLGYNSPSFLSVPLVTHILSILHAFNIHSFLCLEFSLCTLFLTTSTAVSFLLEVDTPSGVYFLAPRFGSSAFLLWCPSALSIF